MRGYYWRVFAAMEAETTNNFTHVLDPTFSTAEWTDHALSAPCRNVRMRPEMDAVISLSAAALKYASGL